MNTVTVTDLVLLDVKSWDTALYRRLTGAALHPTLTFPLADTPTPTAEQTRAACARIARPWQ